MRLLILSAVAFNPLNLSVLGAGSNRFSNGDVNLSELLLSILGGAVLPVLLLCPQTDEPPDTRSAAAESLRAVGQQVVPCDL